MLLRCRMILRFMWLRGAIRLIGLAQDPLEFWKSILVD